jgi:transcriptional regulator with XRE-family HTH domain
MGYACAMADYSLEALGQVVKRLRWEKGLTQEELGDAAGYGKGAGVSISRLEHGRLEPTDKFTGIARALGVSTQELQKHAAEETAAQQSAGGDGARTQADRIAAIVRASERRKLLAPELDAFNEARKRAERDFLMTFRELAAHVIDAPAQDQDQLAQGGGAETDEAEAEATYQIRFTQYGVSQALADPAGSAAVGGAVSSAAAYLAFTDAVALGTAPLGAMLPRLTGAKTALKGLRAAMGVGRSARIGSTAGGMNLVAAVAVGAVVATILDRQASAKRNRKQQESAAKLAAAEADIATNQANVDALLDVIPRATEILDYIAVHASHALTRWGAQIGEDPVPWRELGEAEQQRYQDFVAVAAAQLAVATIDFQELATSREEDLDQATALADQILIQSQRAIASRA